MAAEENADHERAAELLRHAADIVVELGLDGRLLYVSDAVETIVGRSARSLIGVDFLEVVVPEDRDATAAIFQKVVETGREPTFRFRVARSDGLRVELEAVVRVFVDRVGETRIVIVCRDVTQQSSHQAVDLERNAHYRHMVESSFRPAAIATPCGEILFSNRRFKAVFGSQANLLEIAQRVNDDARETVARSWRGTDGSHESGSGTLDLRYTHPDGSKTWFALTWEGFRNEHDERCFSLLFEDITRRKKVELALRALAMDVREDARASAQHMAEVLADVLDLDRIVIGRLDSMKPGELRVEAAWQDGDALSLERLSLDGLPDLDVARGEPRVHPSGIDAMMPDVARRVGPGFESYAGIPLRRGDGAVIGLIGAYGREPIHEPEVVRTLLSVFAAHGLSVLDRNAADRETQLNQARFDAMARYASDLVIEVDAEERITYISDSCIELLGIRPEPLIGQPVTKRVHPEDAEIAQRSREQLESGADRFVSVTRTQDARGRWHWFESKVSRFETPDGSTHALILARDTTERRREELGRDLLFKVVQHGTELIFVCETDTTLLYANEAATHLLGTDALDETRERTLFELLSAEDARRLRVEILPTLTHRTPWSGSLELIGGPDAPSIATEARIFLFEGSEDSTRSYLAVTLRDVTRRRTAEEALRESELRLSQAQKMEAVGRLAGGIAHDFNNLLTSIIGYSDLVLEELGDAHANRADVEEIMRAAERAGGLTRQLLAFSRRQVLQPRAVELNAVVADIDRMMRRLIGENIELVTLQTGELQRIIADPGQIEQVVVNLVVNARDAMPRGGRLEIETAHFSNHEDLAMTSGVLEPGDYVLLRVSDTGTGMTPKVRAQIFEPFFTTKEAHRGTGLGLATVYGIVSQSGGQIDVDTAPGHGTTFSIYLPIAGTQTDEVRSFSAPSHVAGNETILLVEDSDPVRGLVCRTLEKAGYEVLAADSATAALRLASRHQGPIDLILTDVVLPRMPGPEIARRTLALRPEIRVLFMSGFTDDTLIQHGLEPENDVILEKPFTPSILLSRIRDVLDQARPASSSESTPDAFPVEHSD
jgi:PAS domain S-box-containing protein